MSRRAQFYPQRALSWRRETPAFFEQVVLFDNVTILFDKG
jgi:hypothetical protein